MIGTNIALSQRINHKLNIFDHTIFHTDREPLPFIADIADKNNSGAEVPIANIVSHMNSGDNLKILATLTLELINLSAENHNKNSHANSIIIAKCIVYNPYKINDTNSNILHKKYKIKKKG